MIVSEKMLDIQRQREDADKEWRREESRLRRVWEAEQAVLAEQHHQKSMAIAVSGNKGNVWSNLAQGFIGLIAALAAVIFGWWLGSQSNSANVPTTQPPPATSPEIPTNHHDATKVPSLHN